MLVGEALVKDGDPRAAVAAIKAVQGASQEAGSMNEAESNGPDEKGRFGDFGGRFMPEALMAALDELTAAWHEATADKTFTDEFHRMLREYAGVPSPLYDATKLGELAGARILLKREDLNHTGAHKIRNVLGQALLTKPHGQAADDRRDRCRPARCRDRHCCGVPRSRVHRLHG